MAALQITVQDPSPTNAYGHWSVERISVLLCELTDSFVRWPEPRSQKQARPYEQLALNLISRVDTFTKATIAQKLSRRRDTPRGLLEALLSEETGIAEPLVVHSPLLNDVHIERILGSGNKILLQALQRRNDLSDAQRQNVFDRLNPDQARPQPIIAPAFTAKPRLVRHAAPQDMLTPQMIAAAILTKPPEVAPAVSPTSFISDGLMSEAFQPDVPQETGEIAWLDDDLDLISAAMQDDEPALAEAASLEAAESPDFAMPIALGETHSGKNFESATSLIIALRATGVAKEAASEAAEMPEAIHATAPAVLPSTAPLAPAHASLPRTAPKLVPQLIRAAVLRRTKDIAIVLSIELGISSVITEALLKDSSGEALTAACRHLDIPEDAVMQIATLLYPNLTRTTQALAGLRQLYRQFTATDTRRIVAAWRNIPSTRPVHEPVHAPAKDAASPVATAPEQAQDQASVFSTR